MPAKVSGYRLAPRARTDLEAVWLYGFRTWSLEQADAYQRGLVRCFEALAAHPEMARERSNFSPPVRVHVHGAHLVVYRIEVDHVLIVRVLHARQDWRSILGS